jgi:endoglucanase Acf2
MAPLPKYEYGSIATSQEEDVSLLKYANESVGEAPKSRRGGRFVLYGAIAFTIIGATAFLILGSTESNTVDSHFVSPLSLSPEDDLGLQGTTRDEDSLPSPIWGSQRLLSKMPLPTNSWYLNLVSLYAAKEPNDSTRAYTVPFIIDTATLASNMAGIRVHWPVLQASDRNMQMVYDANSGLVLGTTDTGIVEVDDDERPLYTVDDEHDLSLLGVSLKWGGGGNGTSNKGTMVSHIVRGMPYATMRYSNGVLPAIKSSKKLASPPMIDDGSSELSCGELDADDEDNKTVYVAKKNIQLHFKGSDFTWMVFVSHPVKLQCSVVTNEEEGPGVIPGTMFQLDIVEYGEEELTVRAALIDACTTGQSDIQKHCSVKNEWKHHGAYVQLLKDSAHLFPASPKINFEYDNDDDHTDASAVVTFDWDMQDSNSSGTTATKEHADGLLMFALPHHQEQLLIDDESSSTAVTEHCIPTFHGSTCLVKGRKWSINEELGGPQSFVAERPPEPWAIPELAKALSADINYVPPNNIFRAASDTYFSGKILARLGRVILIASEMKQLATASPKRQEFSTTISPIYKDVSTETYTASAKAAKEVDLPTDEEITAAVERLREAVQVWVNGSAEAPYIYDRSWGGMINCGCDYAGEADLGSCQNVFPECPALTDVNVDFGNGYYNDHHFHYGYHIYAAAVVAKYDPEWGKEFFDGILLYIRDIATPTPEDKFFTQYRQKDWFLGSSWASGIISAENSPHGRNQESSSEAIAAYEAVSLFGAVMVRTISRSFVLCHLCLRNILSHHSFVTSF